MVRGALVIILSLVGIFVHPFPPGIIDFLFRLLLFSGIIYLIYSNQKSSLKITQVSTDDLQKTKPSYTDKFKEEFFLTDFLSNDDRIINFIKNQFDVVAGIIFPDHGCIFYKYSVDKVKLFHVKAYNEYSYESNSEIFPLSGLLKILDDKDELLIENNLNNEKNLINYISDSEYTAASFLGFPVTIVSDQKLFYVFDSHNKENFNKEDRELIEKIRGSIKVMLVSRLKAFSLYNNLKVNESLLAFCKELNGCKTISLAIDKLAVKISEEFEATRLTISTVRSNTNIAVIKKVVGQENDFGENTEFPLEEGLTGWVISKNKPYIIEDLEKGDYFIPRYNKNEKSNYGFRSFLGIPIKFENKIFGAITLEHQITHKYKQKEKEELQRYVDIFSTTFLRNY